jgi:hypothetical protein
MKLCNLCLVLLAPVLCFGLEVEPDSLVVSLKPFSYYNDIIDLRKKALSCSAMPKPPDTTPWDRKSGTRTPHCRHCS